MRLVYLDPHPLTHPLPAVMQIIQTVDALACVGVEITLVVPEAGPTHAIQAVLNRDLHPNVRLMEIPDISRRWWFPLRSNRPFFWRAKKYLANSIADAVLLRNLKLAGRLLDAKPKLPVFFETHEIFSQSYLDAHLTHTAAHKRKHASLLSLERKVYGNSAGLIAITSALAADVRAQFNASAQICIAPDGVDLDSAARAKTKIKNATLVERPQATVLYLGSLHQWKGVETLVAAMDSVPNAHLTIAGGEEHRIQALRDFARTKLASARIHFLGKVPPAQRFEVINSADICVLPLTRNSIASRYTSPLKLFEYMAMGKPIVAGDLPAIREILTHEINALLVPPENPSALALALNRLVEDAELATRLGKAAAEAAQDYSWRKRAQTVASFIQTHIARML